MKDSLAFALRHSREAAQNVYDRRTANERKQKAVEMARQKAESATAQDVQEQEPVESSDSETGLQPGQFVGLVEPDSSLQAPRILLARVHSFQPGRQASLLWYKHLGGSVYGLEVDGSQWLESIEALVAVTVKPAKNRPGCVRLFTSPRTVHKAIHGNLRQS